MTVSLRATTVHLFLTTCTAKRPNDLNDLGGFGALYHFLSRENSIERKIKNRERGYLIIFHIGPSRATCSGASAASVAELLGFWLFAGAPHVLRGAEGRR